MGDSWKHIPTARLLSRVAKIQSAEIIDPPVNSAKCNDFCSKDLEPARAIYFRASMEPGVYPSTSLAMANAAAAATAPVSMIFRPPDQGLTPVILLLK